MVSLRMLFSLLATGLLCPVQAFANWEYTHWGMRQEQVIAASNGAVQATAPEPGATDGEKVRAAGTYKLGPLTLEVEFVFHAKFGLRCVRYAASGEEAAQLKAELVKRYGPPTLVTDSQMAESLEWDKPDRISVVMGGPPIAAGVIQCAP
jgi:hypothetical protein